MTSRTFACAALSVSAARRFVTAQLTQLDGLTELDQDLVDLAELLVSELATNCVLHALTDFVVSVTRSATSIRVEVTDHGPGTPQVGSPRPTDTHGRGLRFVDSFADEWGTINDTDGTKTIWFELGTVMPRTRVRAAEASER